MRKYSLPIALLICALCGALVSQAQYGTVITVAGGSSWAGYAGDGDTATASAVSFFRPTGVSTDSAGDIFIYDMDNYRIRKVAHGTHIVTTIAGNGTSGYSGDGGPGPLAEIASTWSSGLAADKAGNCYIVDAGNYRIRRIDYTTGIITTVAGDGSGTFSGDGGPATSAGVSSPGSVYVDANENIYITDGDRIREVNAATGIINTIAGTGTDGFSGDGGPATSATMKSPYAVTGDLAGNIYFSDAGNYRVRMINTSGIINTIAGNGTSAYSGDGGLATAASLINPKGMGTDSMGNVYVTDGTTGVSGVVRKINTATTGIINTVAGRYGGGGSSVDHTTGSPADSTKIDAEYLYVDKYGNMFYTDGAGWTQKIINATSGINTWSVSDSLETPTCTLPATVGFGVDGTITATPTSTDSLEISVNYRQFATSSIITRKIPYWYTTTYGFGSIYSAIGSFTYTIPGIYTPVITITNFDGYSDETTAPTIQVGSDCSSSVTGISITSTADSFTSLPCSIPMNVRYIVNGTITGTPSAGDSAYVVYAWDESTDSFQIDVVPYTLSGSTYIFTDTATHGYVAGGYHPEVMAVTSSGSYNTIVYPTAFVVSACTTCRASASITDTATLTTYCSLPFTDKYNVSGTLTGYADTAANIKVYVNYGDGTDTNFTAPIFTDGLGTFYYGNTTGHSGTPITLFHTYSIPGAYAVTHTDTAGSCYGRGSATTRTLGTSCSPVSGIFYIDTNGDCFHEAGEPLLGYWPYALINNTLGDTTYGWCDDSGYYALELVDGDSYALVANPYSYFHWLHLHDDSLHTSCPLSGTYSITATTGSVYSDSFAFSCTPVGTIDMTIAGWGWGFVPGDTGIIGIWSSDFLGYICDSLYATVYLTLDPTLTYVGMWDGPTPTVTGSILSWTFSTVGDLFDFTADVKVVTPTTATLGTLVCNTLSVTPTPLPGTGSSYSWCEPVSDAWDPNEKQVSPTGYGPQGYITNETPLSYVIHFQNTGTAIAQNITVVDTMNENLDISTLQVINSSSPVLVYQDPGNVIRFKFNNINLPDSIGNPLGSVGYIAYNIMPYADLAPGTQITNDAAVYFDYNPPVITNTTLNTITDSATNVISQGKSVSVQIFPNPATDELFIKMDKGAYQSFTITNNIGQVLIQQDIQQTLTTLNIKSLIPGIYFISLRGENGTKVEEFMKNPHP